MFKRYPLLLPLIAIVCGILIAGFNPLSITYSILILLCCSLLALWLTRFNRNRNFGFFFLIFIGIGLVTTSILDERTNKFHYTNHYHGKQIYQGYLLSEPVKTKNALRLEVELNESFKDSLQSLKGKIFLYIPKDSLAELSLPGDLIYFETSLNELQGPRNPHEFDYRNYLHLHQVYVQAYASNFKIKRQSHFSLKKIFVSYRRKLFQHISDMHLGPDEEAVASALLLGYRHLISDETQQAFSGAGAMHVLAVSGLHVGILYIITAFLLGLNKRKPHKNPLQKVLLAIAIIWMYAMLTGLSPSVTRAAVMFTFIAFGNLSRRKTSINQSIIASAILMLVYNPNYLFEVGFQLSYAAVFGIVYLQPKIYKQIKKPRYWLIDKVWQITSVSLAAQAATFPFSVYYFHQFPLFFVVSNLVVIPTAWLLMNYGILLLFISTFLAPPAFLVIPFQGILKFMIASVKLVESLPGSIVGGLSISRLELVLLVIIVFSLTDSLWFRRKRALLLFGFTAIVLVFLNIKEETNHISQKSITIYSIPKQTAIEIRNGKNSTLILDGELLNNTDAKLFHIYHNLWASGAKTHTEIDFQNTEPANNLRIKNGIIDSNLDRILIYKNDEDSNKLALKPDILYAVKGSRAPLNLPKHLTVVLQNGHNSGTKETWMRRGRKVYDLEENGAFVINFD